jgi:hypothetical protein
VVCGVLYGGGGRGGVGAVVVQARVCLVGLDDDGDDEVREDHRVEAHEGHVEDPRTCAAQNKRN